MKKNFVARMIITFAELTNILANIFGQRKDGTNANGCTMCSATWVKDVESMNGDLKAVKVGGAGRALKSNNPYYGHLSAIKVANNLQFGYSYENAVNNHLAKQGDEKTFESGALRWGHWFEYEGVTLVNRIIEHNENLYIRFYNVANTEIRTTYFLDGIRVTDKAVIADIIANINDKDNNIKTQESAGLTEENQVHPFAVAYKNLKHLSIGGGRYTII
jgi:hypothetical protein